MLISFAVSKKQEEIYKLFRNLDKCCTSLQGKQNNILNITFLSMWNLHLAEPLHQQSVCNAILFCVTSISYRQHQLLTNLGILKRESLFETEPHFPHQIQSVRKPIQCKQMTCIHIHSSTKSHPIPSLVCIV